MWRRTSGWCTGSLPEEALAMIRLLLALAVASSMLFTFCSCDNLRIVPVRPTQPVLKRSQRPQLQPMAPDDVKVFNALPDSLKKNLIENNQAMREYCIELETIIDTYNKFANSQNGVNESTMFKGELPTPAPAPVQQAPAVPKAGEK
jgi:hypothetical protein